MEISDYSKEKIKSALSETHLKYNHCTKPPHNTCMEVDMISEDWATISILYPQFSLLVYQYKFTSIYTRTF